MQCGRGCDRMDYMTIWNLKVHCASWPHLKGGGDWPACQPQWTKLRVAMRGSSVQNLKNKPAVSDLSLAVMWWMSLHESTLAWRFDCQTCETLDNGNGPKHFCQYTSCINFLSFLTFHAPPSATLLNIRGLGTGQTLSLSTGQHANPMDETVCCNARVITAKL